MKGKSLLKILISMGLLVIVAIIVAVVTDLWVGLAVVLCSVLVAFAPRIGYTAVSARYDPAGKHGDRKHANHPVHPEDVPLNPWDTITENGEKTE